MCTVGECNNKPRTRGMCQTHYEKARTSGAIELVRRPHKGYTSSNSVTYTRAHERLRERRGYARDFGCTDCINQAQEWSYMHGCPNERQSKYGPYSPDHTYYKPLCASCHRTADIRRAESLVLS
jgi:hypothetical protein